MAIASLPPSRPPAGLQWPVRPLRGAWRRAVARWAGLVLTWALPFAPPVRAGGWRPAGNPLTTPWTNGVTPERVWPEYPRPQLVRATWTSLNGLWDYAVTPAGAAEPTTYEGQILVPFAIESALSGVGRKFEPSQRLTYHRTFARPDLPAGHRLLLHFGAVDWSATVRVNGRTVAEHRGGYDPFTVDITEALTGSVLQHVVVDVTDPSESGFQPVGKQTVKAVTNDSYYTPVSGIWQTVWLEDVPAAHIVDVRAVSKPSLDAFVVTVFAEGSIPDAGVVVQLRDGARVVGRVQGRVGAALDIPVPSPQLWTPDAPHLYQIEAALSTGDQVTSYGALRTISVRPDAQRLPRLALNGVIGFQFGPLDQGYWPDGLYTAPTDEALRADIEAMKRMGFNAVRKHVKVEPARWYYWCDKLGLLVWQDLPSPRGLREEEGRKNFEAEARRIVDALRPFPSVVMWTLFNEGWGQGAYGIERSAELANWLQAYDPSRLVNPASGWTDVGNSQVRDLHLYPMPDLPPVDAQRAAIVGEFGGLRASIEAHTWSLRSNPLPPDANAKLRSDYAALIATLRLAQGQGAAGAIYTQLSDIENEVNGFLTYDRQVNKFGEAWLRDLNASVYGPPPVVTTLAGGMEPWSYTATPPPSDWIEPQFKAADWPQGRAPFGANFRGAQTLTAWRTPELWLRRVVQVPEAPGPAYLILRTVRGARLRAAVNGRVVHDGETKGLQYVALPAAILRAGANVVTVQATRGPGPEALAHASFDARLITVSDSPRPAADVTAASGPVAAGAGARSFDVTQFGAVGDGRTLATAAIQRAIDACAAAGGGVVQFPAGRFLSGTLFLRSGVTLNLEADATLLGSPNPADYPPTRPSSVRSFNDGRTQLNLIFAENLTDVAITGAGTIDGQGGTWPKRPRGAGDRPFVLRFVACRNVRVEGVTLRNSGFWMQHYLECDDVVVRNVHVFNHANWNNDAIDIDGCHRVLVERLTSDTSDDGITLKSTTLRANEDVTVRDCVVRTHAVGIKFGTESIGGFKHIRIERCQVERSAVEHDEFGGRLGGKGGIAIMSLDGAAIADVVVSDIKINGTLSPLFVRLHDRGRAAEPGKQKPIGSIRGLTLRDIVATNAEPTGSLIAGIPGHPIEDVVLQNVRIVAVGGAKVADVKVPTDEFVHGGGAGPGMFGLEPAFGILFYHVKGVTLDGVAVEARQPDQRPGLVFCDADGVVRDGRALSPETPDSDIRFLSRYVVAPAAKQTAAFEATTFGAVAGGHTVSTAAIQRAIDAAAGAGGGTVTFQPGTYMTGALFLKSNVELNLGDGVTLRAVADAGAYPEIDSRSAGVEMKWPAAIVTAVGQANVSITGRGVIDGNGGYWWTRYWGDDHHGGMRADYERRGLRWAVDWDCKRPQTLLFKDCTTVAIRGIRIERSPFWTVQLTYCSGVVVEGITIRNNIGGTGPSTDGIDVDSSRDVLIENCDIACFDDNICLKAGRDADGLRVNRPTENVIVRNCITRAGHGMFTLGSETAGGIRHVEVYGLRGVGTRNGIRFKSTWPRGGVVEDIRIHDIEMEDVGTAFAFSTGGTNDYPVPPGMRGTELPAHWDTITRRVEPAERGIPEYRNISIERIRATRTGVAFNATGRAERPLRDFHFAAVRVDAEQPGAIRHASDWTMDQVVVATPAAQPVAREDCTRVAEPTVVRGERSDDAAGATVHLSIVSEHRGPLIGPGHPGTLDNRSGFETGCVVWHDGVAHLFVNEMFGLPHLDLRIAHWTSRDGESWQREGTLVESIAGRSPQNPRSEVWLNGVAFDELENRWNMFYVGYRGGDGARGEIPGSDYEGRIWRAVSVAPGRGGLGGPYRDADIILRPDEHSLGWEGQQGVDSFYPYPCGDTWRAFYGSHNHLPRGPWLVGLASAPALAGPWRRDPDHSPVPLVKTFVENPVVEAIGDGRWLAVFDSDTPHAIGYSASRDGVKWTAEQTLEVQGADNRWSGPNGLRDVRTPLGLIPRPDGTYVLLYTAKMASTPFYAIGQCIVRLD